MRRRWTSEELEETWTLGPDEHALISGKRGPTRLGFAVLVRFFAKEGRRFPGPEEIPEEAVSLVARQVGVPDGEYAAYDRTGRTAEYHWAQIRKAFGFRPATVGDAEELAGWLLEEVAPREYDAERIKEAAYARLRALKIEPPTPGRVERLARSALRRYDERFCETTLGRLPEDAVAGMDDLLSEPEGQEDGIGADPSAREEPTLARLRADPGRAGVEGARAELAKLARLRELRLPEDLFAGTEPNIVRAYRRRAASESPSSLRAHPPAVRYALLAALCFLREREVTDGLVEVLLQVVHNIGARSERKVEKILLADFKKVSGKGGMLVRVAEAALAEPDGLVRDVVFPVVGENTLTDLVREAKATGAAYRARVQLKMRSSYAGYYRQALPAVLGALEFRSNNADHRPVVRALDLVKAYAGSQKRFYEEDEVVPPEVVPPAWRGLVLKTDGRGASRVDRVAYELCVLEALREGLRSKEVWVEGADRYRNPDEDLPQDFGERREHYYGSLGQPMEADQFVEDLQTAMEAGLQALDENVPNNIHLRLRAKGNARISLAKLAPQPEPPNLDGLKADIVRNWPMTGLLDILKETDLRLGFTERFATVASRRILAPDTLRKRLLLCLYGLGTNTGLKRVAAGDPESGYQDLRYVRRRFVHKEQLRSAIACVADGIFSARSAEVWGEATTACASDSKKFGAWDQNLMTEWSIRHRGRGCWRTGRRSTWWRSLGCPEGMSSSGPEGSVATAKRFVSGLVLDRKLSPRERLGSNHVRQLVEALRAGATLPPIVVERGTSRVVDGFHRVEAHRRVYGREALIEVVEKEYADEGELFLDAVRLNAAHGSRLAPYDQLRCVTIAARLSVDPDRVAGALSVRPSYVGELSLRRTGSDLATRAPVPLKRTIEHMRGRPLTPAQMEANRKLGGQAQAFYVNQLIILLENDLLDTENENLMVRVGRLKSLLSRVAAPEAGG